MSLTAIQTAILERAEETGEAPFAADMRLVPGFHFCPCWDYLAICDDSPEIEACTCEVETDE